jgi:hypothetical protein
MRLFREVRQRGYGGSYGVVAAYARRLRQAQDLPPGHRCSRQPLVVRKNSFIMPLDEIPSTCDNTYEGILLPVVEGHIGYDTMSTLAPHPLPYHRHAMDSTGR